MLSTYPFWWFALPVLLLPVWWHRQKRQRVKAETLATARFLPAAAPEQLRVWRWRDPALLLARCLLLIALIAWLAATILPWRGDTVLVDASLDPAWAEQQIKAAGLGGAQRMALPAEVLPWLRQHERDWRADARLLIVANAGKVAMPARAPQFAHALELRVKPAAPAAAPALHERHEHHIVVAAQGPHMAAWRTLFAAFDLAGTGGDRYVVDETPDRATELIVWDMPGAAPPAGWRAPLWWIGAPAAAAMPELAGAATLRINREPLSWADSARGRLWTSPAWPPRDADGARALFETWKALGAAAPAYPAASQIFAIDRKGGASVRDAAPAPLLAYALLALFLLERILTHARRI
jgi:hypothetical protein